MQSGEFITDRLLPGLVLAAAQTQDLQYQTYSDDWVIRLQKGDVVCWIVGYKFDINLAAAGQIAQDKVAAYQVLESANIPAVPHVLIRSVAGEPVHQAGLDNYGKVVMKPLTGTGGRGVELQPDVGQALAAIQMNPEPAWALSPYYEITTEYRLILLDNEIVLAYEKVNPSTRGGLKFFNLGLGAHARDIAVSALDPQLAGIARAAATALGLRLAAVDVVNIAGSWRVLEINDGLMMENYARQSVAQHEQAAQLYAKVVAVMFSGKP